MKKIILGNQTLDMKSKVRFPKKIKEVNNEQQWYEARRSLWSCRELLTRVPRWAPILLHKVSSFFSKECADLVPLQVLTTSAMQCPCTAYGSRGPSCQAPSTKTSVVSALMVELVIPPANEVT